MQYKKRKKTAYSERKSTRTLDFFEPREYKEPKRTLWPDATQGTLEWHRSIYYDEGFDALLSSLRGLGLHPHSEKFETILRAVLYGMDKNNVPLTQPVPPSPKLMDENLQLWKFFDKVYRDYLEG